MKQVLSIFRDSFSKFMFPAILISMLVFTACGGGGDDSSSDPAQDPTTTVQDPADAKYLYQLSILNEKRGDGTLNRSQEFEYDANGTVTKMTKKKYQLDGTTLIETDVNIYVQNSLGLITEERRDTVSGELIAKYTYDELNRVIKIESYDSVTLERIYTVTYDSAGEAIWKVTDASGNVIEKFVDIEDSNGFLVSSEEWNSSDNGTTWIQNDYREYFNHTDGRVEYFNIYEGPNFNNSDSLASKREYTYVSGNLSKASYVVIDWN